MNQQLSIADRTKALAIRIVKAYTFLDEKPGVCRTLSKQLLRSGTPIQFAIVNSQFAIIILGNFYRQINQLFNYIFLIANCELRIANCSEYWLEILIEAELVDKNKFESLLQETREIGKILVSSTRKVKEKINKLN
ncbi:four helix bundle protein [Nostoc sp. FACHB-892]|uniref:four helix bundle protein n=1 Tax=Nostoc sp. FACHB-892 TaxID=2692843 RepID=UPI0016871C1D|nr:four helix bundle protein [Nostoc sp. FACHB-892]MBD2730473.1 four helix bundle protein [Nostoc sp. FACHB-892]